MVRWSFVSGIEVLLYDGNFWSEKGGSFGGVSMFLIFSLQIFQPEYTLLFKPFIVGNFERKGGNTCL